MKTRVFSGMQPTGNLHIGNYLGALKNWVRIQNDYECIFCIVDLHAVTVYQDPAALRAKIEEIAALYLAAGIDPKTCAIMVQSAVPAHAELAWMLTCVTPVGWLERMTQYKVKAGKQESVSDGILQYPVLMAADIMLYQAGIVPVGEDQAQHLELTRDIAQRFNSLYGDTFVVPDTSLPAVAARVMGLDDPTQKMSKSATGANHAVALLDPPDKIRKTIMRAATDSNPAVDFETAGPGVINLLSIYQAFDGSSDAEMRARFTGMRYGDLKKQVAGMVVAHLEPFQHRYRQIVSEPGYLAGVLREGAERVRPIADDTVRLVKARMGLYAQSKRCGPMADVFELSGRPSIAMPMPVISPDGRSDPIVASEVIDLAFKGAPAAAKDGYRRFLAGSVDYLSQSHPASWGITLLDSGVRLNLNVGWVECLVLGGAEGLRVLVKESSARPGTKFDKVTRRWASGCRYVTQASLSGRFASPLNAAPSSYACLRRPFNAGTAIEGVAAFRHANEYMSTIYKKQDEAQSRDWRATSSKVVLSSIEPGTL